MRLNSVGQFHLRLFEALLPPRQRVLDCWKHSTKGFFRATNDVGHHRGGPKSSEAY